MNFEQWSKLNFVKKIEKKGVLLYIFKVMLDIYISFSNVVIPYVLRGGVCEDVM